MKRFLTAILVAVMLVGMIPTALAADWGQGDTLDDALAELKVGFDSQLLDWLTLPGLGVIKLRYTYYLHSNERTGTIDEMPVYCIDPAKGGAYDIVADIGPNPDDGSNTATYIRGQLVGDPRYCAILAQGYPHHRASAFGLQTPEEAYYATKLALWMYIRGNNPSGLAINPAYGNTDPVALRVRDAAISIYNKGMTNSAIAAPSLTLTGKPDAVAKLDASQQYYVQEIEVHTSGWVGTSPDRCGDVQLSWKNTPPVGTIVLGSNGEDITSTLAVTMAGVTGKSGWYGKITMKIPAEAIGSESDALPTLSAEAIVPNNEIYVAYAQAGETKYQRYLVERDPKIQMSTDFIVNVVTLYEEDFPGDTGLRIYKKELGTNLPLSGAVFSIRDPEGKLLYTLSTSNMGVIEVPLSVVGNYTVTEESPSQYHLLPDVRTQSVTVRFSEVAEVTFVNAPYGMLQVHKKDFADGRNLAGAVIQIRNITTGVTQTAMSDSSGAVTFDKLLCTAEGTGYEIRELASPLGYALSSEVHTVSVRPLSEGITSYTLTNKANAGLRIRKFDQQSMLAIENITFEVWHDGSLYGEYTTDMWGEILLINIPAGTYTAKEKSTVEPYILDPTPQTIEIKAGDGIKELVFHNLKKPTLIIKKYDELTAKALPNTEFSVTKKGSIIVWEGLTGSDGTITLPDMDEGWYTISEIAPAPGYLPASGSKDVYLEGGKVVEVKFDNLPCPTLTVSKTNSITHDPIAGVKFNVKFSPAANFSGGVVDLGNYITDADGKILLNDNLQSGWYRIEELEPAPGFSMKEPAVQDIFLKGGDNKTVHFENIPLSALVIRKIDSATKLPVAGATFTIRYLGGTSGSGGTIIHTGVTSANGTILLTGLQAGTYVCEETAPAASYELSNPSVQTAYISGQSQDVVELLFSNAKMGNLVITKLHSVTKQPLAGATFKVTFSDGAVIGPNNGLYTTDESGVINIAEDLPIGSTVVVTEHKAPDGFILDGTPQTVKIKEATTHSLTFYNSPKSGLQIVKIDSITRQPLKGVEFAVYKKSGDIIGTFETDGNGIIIIPALEPGWVKIVETKCLPGYILNDTPKDVKIKSNEFHKVVFENTPLGGLQILKLDEQTRRPIAGAEFRVARMNGEIIGTFRTDSNGIIHIPEAASGWFTVVETKSAKSYILDDTVHTIEVKDGQTAVLTITNAKASGILIHKVDSITKKGIYGATFLLYDANNNPIGQYESDQGGYVWIGGGLPAGKYKIRELSNDGYVADDVVRTIYLEYGRTTEITWENTPEMGQIMVTKRSAAYNEVTHLAAGSPLAGAVFEVYTLSGNLADRMVSDSRGIAVSKLLPPAVYVVKEVSPPRFYATNPREYIAEIRHNGDIVRFEVLNDNVQLGVTVQKKSQNQITQNQMILWDLFNVANTSSAPLENFFLHDRLPTDAVRGAKVFTGTWSHHLTYQVSYKTNYSSSYRVLASGLSTKTDYELSIHPNVLGLQSGEYVTDIRWEFGTVPAGFCSVVNPRLQAQVLATLPQGYKIVNRADVGGLYCGEWLTAQSSWTTLIYGNPTPPPELPKTGF